MKSIFALFKAPAPWSIMIAVLVLILAAVPVAAVLGLLALGLDQIYLGGRQVRGLAFSLWEQQITTVLAGGVGKTRATLATLRAGIARRLLVDETLARALLDHKDT